VRGAEAEGRQYEAGGEIVGSITAVHTFAASPATEKDGDCSGRAGASKELIDSTRESGAVLKDPKRAAMDVDEGNLGAR